MAVTIHQGQVLDVLPTLPDQSVQCVVTSPPYYGLRDYGIPPYVWPDGWEGVLGMEPTLAQFIEHLVGIFREVRRVLRDDGVVWLNLGDSFGNKQLQMVPARVAIALQDDGWWLRSDVIWAKPNPMPESCKDRPTSAHEHIFLLTKSARYYYDADAVRTPAKAGTDYETPDGWDTTTGEDRHGTIHKNGREKGDKQRGHSRRHDGFNDRWDSMSRAEQQAMGANLRNVWTIATKPFKEAHFATFPPEIPERCIKAGSRPGDVVLDLFGGSGTVGVVGEQLERETVLIEVKHEYVEMATRRITAAAPLLTVVEVIGHEGIGDAGVDRLPVHGVDDPAGDVLAGSETPGLLGGGAGAAGCGPAGAGGAVDAGQAESAVRLDDRAPGASPDGGGD